MQSSLSSAELATVKEISSLRWQADLYFSPNFVSTYICNFIFVIYLNNLFPRFKIVQFKVLLT
nr:hypothetical protein [Mycoplasmopsis bovis]